MNPGGRDHDDLVRLHLSESAYGPSPTALRAAEAALRSVRWYPDPARTVVTEVLAEHWDLAPGELTVGNGSDELVLLSCLALAPSGAPGLVSAGTFPGYRTALQATGRAVREVPLAGTGFDVAAFARELPGAGIGFVCNPHNPTGSALSGEDLALLIGTARRSGVPLVVDEAYMEFAPAGTPQVRDHLPDRAAPVLALRTLSKAYGLAGVRIGYALGAPALVGAVRAAQASLPFSVNRPAQAAAVAAVADQRHLDSVRLRVAGDRDWFTAELRRRAVPYLPSVTNFVTVAAGDSARVQERLHRETGILVRDAGAFGLAGHLRVSLGPRDHLRRFLAAADELGLRPPPSPRARTGGSKDDATLAGHRPAGPR